jgi:hypothetical protein
LLESPRDKLAAQVHAQENFPQAARNVKDVFGIDGYGGVADHFGQRTYVRAHHRCSAGHGFEWRQAESFIQRRKHERRR